jgi:hypothetical protein
MKGIAFMAFIFSLLGCGTLQKSSLEIEAHGISPALAQSLVAQYYSNVPDHDLGNEVSIARCSDLKSQPNCDYLITHWGNGCGWGSYVKEICSSGNCTFTMSAYDEEAICE